MNNAAAMKWDDFEDALQAATAKRIHADYIITRNIKDFKGSKTTAFTPAELLAIFGEHRCFTALSRIQNIAFANQRGISYAISYECRRIGTPAVYLYEDFFPD